MSTKRKPTTTIARPVVKQSAKIPTKSRIDETRASVAIGRSQKPDTAVVEISDSNPNSDAEEDQSEDESPEDSAQPETTAPEVSKLKPSEDGDVDMEQGDSEDAEVPSFGDMIRGNSTVDVSASLAADASSQARAGGEKGAVTPVNAISMGVTLEQALKTDDNELLESVLQITNIETIRNTITRMDSALASILLSKLAMRMHRRPGRVYGLMNWVQWTLIAHGGALVGQPDLVKRLEELNRVLEERSRGLTSLLALKGKLDMLDGQMQFRKAIRSQNPKSKTHDEEESDEDEAENVDEPGVVFVEGDGNEIKVLEGTAIADDDDEGDYPVMNGIGEDSDEDEEDDEDFADEDELEEESMDEDEVDHDDVEESGEEESDNEDSGPPAKVQKVASKFAKRK